jgi:hypothetical protein
MGTPRADRHHCRFGQRRLEPREAAALLSVGIDPAAIETLTDAGLALTRRVTASDHAEFLFAWCQLHGDDVAKELDGLRQLFVLPLRTATATAEVLAEALTEMRGCDDAGRRTVYSTMSHRCRRVIRTFVDEVLGFVPSPPGEQLNDPLAGSIAEWIELPDELHRMAACDFDGATATVVAAQALLEDSRHDRRRLLSPPETPSSPPLRSTSVAELLSRQAALSRFRCALDHAATWVRACARSSASLSSRSAP